MGLLGFIPAYTQPLPEKGARVHGPQISQGPLFLRDYILAIYIISLVVFKNYELEEKPKTHGPPPESRGSRESCPFPLWLWVAFF